MTLEDTIKFENPKKSPYNLKILKDPYHASSVLLLSVLPNDLTETYWKKLSKTDMILLL